MRNVRLLCEVQQGVGKPLRQGLQKVHSTKENNKKSNKITIVALQTKSSQQLCNFPSIALIAKGRLFVLLGMLCKKNVNKRGRRCDVKVKVTDGCIGCGLCQGVCPQVFEMGEDGLSHVVCNDDAFAEGALQCAVMCPVDAIEVEV